MENEEVLVIDSHFLCHRAKHADKDKSPLNTTGVIDGFLSQIKTLCTLFQTNNVIFCWDSKSSVRKKIFKNYKNKEEHKNKLTVEEEQYNEVCYTQFDYLRNSILKFIGFKNNLIQPGYETDDIIARMVKAKCDTQNFTVIARDNDLLQLLDWCVLYDPVSLKLTNRESFVETWGIEPSQWGLVKAIAGCKSDTVPGIGGVGEKTAIKYIKGELSTHLKTYKEIELNHDVIKRNKQLVVLPFEGTKLYKIKDNDFSLKNFKTMCNHFGLINQLERRTLNWWAGFFEGWI